MSGIRIFVAENQVSVLALASLLWLIVGLVLGNRLPRRQGAGRSITDREGGGAARKQQSQYELYVGNLPYEMDDAGLKKLIDPFGDVLSARIITNRISGASKGYGFVKMASDEDVRSAVGSLNNKEIDGRRISVSEARTRSRGRRG